MALLACGAARASARPQIAVDWSGVPDGTIRACKLDGLENLLVQYLIEARYAVVDVVDEHGIMVRIDADGRRFALSVRGAGLQRERDVPIPSDCDSSIQLDLIHAVLDMANAGRQTESGGAPILAVTSSPLETTTASPPRADERVRLAAGLVAPGSRSVLVQLAADAPLGLLGPWVLRLGGDVSVASTRAVWIAEPALRASLERRLVAALLVVHLGVEAAALAHLYAAGERGGHLDGRLALLGSVTYGHAFLTFAPHLRGTPVRHLVGPLAAHELSRWGVALRAGVRL